MRHTKQILICVGFIVLALAAWYVAINHKSDAALQLENLEAAKEYLADEVYILAVPHLEAAASYKGDHTEEAEALLRDAYTHLFNDSAYMRKYQDLLETEIAREDCPAAVFLEAARYYQEMGRSKNVFAILHDGLQKTDNDEELRDYYESIRYEYLATGKTFQDLTLIYKNTVQVKDLQTGLWGLANRKGTVEISCDYDKISTYDNYCVAMKDGDVFTIDDMGFRTALCHEACTDFGNLSGNRFFIKLADGWKVATAGFSMGSKEYENIGMYSHGYAPACAEGKWGLLATNGSTWLIEPAYDGVVLDELGRAYAQKAVFLKQNGKIVLNVDAVTLDGFYDDARPFTDEGWAAVKRNELWGFIDTNGVLQIECRYEDARSFSFGLAAVKIGDKWGYIDSGGNVVIDAVFEEARDFCGGSAPVRKENGWKLITLKEYE